MVGKVNFEYDLHITRLPTSSLCVLLLQISGAAIEIPNPKSSRGDRVAIISGTSEQKRTAENLIQAFIMAT